MCVCVHNGILVSHINKCNCVFYIKEYNGSITLTETSQSQVDKHYMCLLTCHANIEHRSTVCDTDIL